MKTKRVVTEEPATERRDFTFRPDGDTWRRIIAYAQRVELETGYRPSLNAVVLEAVQAWLDVQEEGRKKRRRRRKEAAAVVSPARP